MAKPKNRLTVDDVKEGIEGDCLCYYLTQKVNPSDIEDANLRTLVEEFVRISHEIDLYIDDMSENDEEFDEDEE